VWRRLVLVQDFERVIASGRVVIQLQLQCRV
jgi:hypothetical protein